MTKVAELKERNQDKGQRRRGGVITEGREDER